jgi:N6-adenosine-specific RNA methylase IME4
MQYKTIVADPPWQYKEWGKGSEKSALGKKHNEKAIPMPYQTMSVQEIKNLPVKDLCAPDCELYLI